MESNNMQQQPETADQEIDLIELAQKLWQGRRMIVRWCIAGALAGLVIGFSIPKEYTVTVKLAPEIQGGKTSLGGLGSLASIAGINMGNMNSADAVSPDLYPDIVQSVPFMTELFGVEVADAKDRKTMPLYDYVSEELRGPWWGAVLAAPFKALGWFAGLFRAEEPEDEGPTDPFRLTKEENEVVRSLQERISTSVDKKTQVVSLSVTMQDPLIAATLTDTVMLNLQNHITQYRTDKARHDLEFTQRLFDEAQGNITKRSSVTRSMWTRIRPSRAGASARRRSVCRTRCRWLTASTTRRRSSCSWPGRRSRNRLRSTPWCSPRRCL